ncbi:hypothetical protein HOG48_00300 [Candidatus Peregrinibacteria bacterium]|jgi:hypothetical protein|nr:hypothetical protein [Candidatus Peregrinibacteria bacterium]
MKNLVVLDKTYYVKYELPVSYEITYEACLVRWQWFRKYLMKFYGFKTLPETFDSEDGGISENKRLCEEDGIDYDFRPPEFNYTWRSQNLEFDEDGYHIEIIFNQDELSDWYKFSCVKGDEFSIEFLISSKEQYLRFNKGFPDQAKWLLACEELE